MNADTSSPIPGGEVIVYESPDGEGRVDVRLEDESVWLTQRQMAEVFQSTPQNVLMHLRNVFSCKELDAEATSKDFLIVRPEGRRKVRRKVKHYNLDAIISIGYRVNSKRAVRFRQRPVGVRCRGRGARMARRAGLCGGAWAGYRAGGFGAGARHYAEVLLAGRLRDALERLNRTVACGNSLHSV